ncbi:Dabb family protein [Clostridium sp. AL.422]|uniref:Dabb family protein n=1 Tax=Clostridium TaxID=1485 RepID=UPI00293DFB4C|nr:MULTISPECIES: Dabb family protein [unclassified Clostridium]MDV4149838.1 Dabb family protein [Clostridium sp. AL.422]
MIRHICMFTLKDDNKEKNINDFFKEIEKLRDLSTIKKFNVVRNVENTPASNYDVALIFDFESVETLDEYQTCEEHLEFARFLATIKVDRACIDFEI